MLLNAKQKFYKHKITKRVYLLKDIPDNIEALNKKNCYLIDDSVYFFSESEEEGSISIVNGEAVLIGDSLLEHVENLSFLDFIQSHPNEEVVTKIVLPLDTEQIRFSKRPNHLERISADEILSLPFYDDDDEMVIEVKRWINSKQVTLNSIQEYFGVSDGYNLFYGLRNRKSMTLIAFIRWSEFLELEPVIKLEDRKK